MVAASNLLAKLGLAPPMMAMVAEARPTPSYRVVALGAFDMLPTANQGQENKKKARLYSMAAATAACHGILPYSSSSMRLCALPTFGAAANLTRSSVHSVGLTSSGKTKRSSN